MAAPAPSKLLSRACLIVSTLLLIASAWLGKKAALANEHMSVSGLAGNAWYLAVLACLGMHALVWPLALRTIPLSIAYAVVNPLSLAGILVVARVAFGEPVTALNAAGAGVMVAGLWLLLGPPRRNQQLAGSHNAEPVDASTLKMLEQGAPLYVRTIAVTLDRDGQPSRRCDETADGVAGWVKLAKLPSARLTRGPAPPPTHCRCSAQAPAGPPHARPPAGPPRWSRRPEPPTPPVGPRSARP